jgi:hypothetical protein
VLWTLLSSDDYAAGTHASDMYLPLLGSKLLVTPREGDCGLLLP